MGKKNGAALGVFGGSLGLLRCYSVAITIAYTHCMLYLDDVNVS